MTGVVAHSIWLWLLAGVVLWAFVGLLVASSQRLPLVLGLVLGATTWFFGVFAVLIVGLVRRSARGVRVRADVRRENAAFLPASDPASAWSFGPSTEPRSVGLAGIGGATLSSTEPGRRPDVWLARAALGLALVAGLAMVGSTFLPWGRWRVAWSSNRAHVDGRLSPYEVPIVGFVVSIAGIVVIAMALLFWWRPRGSWLALATFGAAWWFCATTQAIILESGTAIVARETSSADQGVTGASLGTNDGFWLMFAGSVCVFVWVSVGAVELVRMRSPRRRPANYPAPVTGLSTDGFQWS